MRETIAALERRLAEERAAQLEKLVIAEAAISVMDAQASALLDRATEAEARLTEVERLKGEILLMAREHAGPPMWTTTPLVADRLYRIAGVRPPTPLALDALRAQDTPDLMPATTTHATETKE